MSNTEPELAVDTADTTAAKSTAAGTFYQHLDSEQVTQYVPPNSSKVVWQVRGLEPNSGIVFLSMVNDKAFHTSGYVRTHMNRLGHILYDESLVANVVGISVRQDTDSQYQLTNSLDVTVQSTSGDSEGRIIVPYPNVADGPGSVAAFATLVAAEVRLLDANEVS